MLAALMSAIERIVERRLVAVLRRVRDVQSVVDALVDGGVAVVEVTMDSDDAPGWIGRLRARGDLTVLAGTVRTVADAEAAVGAGAEACVAPATVPAVVRRCHELGVPMIPGALTPSEVEAALALGAPLVKIFPGNAVSPGYINTLLAPLADARLMVTGGIDAANARSFLDAGAVAVGAASLLTGAADVEAAARELVRAVS